MFSLSTSMSDRSSLLRPIDFAASSRMRSMHSSRLPWQSLLTSLALSRPASFRASSTSVREGAPPPCVPRATPRASVASVVRQASLAVSSAAWSIQDLILSPSSLAISSFRSLRIMSSVMAEDSRPVTAASMSLAALMHCSLESSGQASSMVQISSFTPSSRYSRTSESLTSPRPLPKDSPMASLMSSEEKHALFSVSDAAAAMHKRTSSDTCSAAPFRNKSRSSSSGIDSRVRPVSVARACMASALDKHASFAASVVAAAEQVLTICFAFSPAIFLISRSTSSSVSVSFLRVCSRVLSCSLHSSKLPLEAAMSLVQFSSVPRRALGAPFSSSKRSLTLSGGVPPVESPKPWRHSSSVLPANLHATSPCWASSLSSRRGGGASRWALMVYSKASATIPPSFMASPS
mmetsp:Transcript_96615/g.134009  ORF Transcript_96615/g.134009 Transcript_96615/m.134009 type:complete len:406 (+) Transcript_96615:1652-2869(+)